MSKGLPNSLRNFLNWQQRSPLRSKTVLLKRSVLFQQFSDYRASNMWYEIIPSFAIISTVMAIPGFGIYYMNKAVLGNAYRRDMRYRWDRRMYERDRRLAGNPYNSPGLEAIPDK